MPSEPKVAGLILAAGSGRRFGASGTKAVAPFAGIPMVRRVAIAALSAGLQPLLVLTGRASAPVEEALAGLDLTFVRNAFPERGQGGSLALGARALSDRSDIAEIDGLAVLLADQPLVDTALIRSVVDAWASQPEPRGIARPVAPGLAAHPVVFAARFLTELGDLEASQSGRDLIRRHAEALVELSIESPLRLRDVDTPEAMAELESLARAAGLDLDLDRPTHAGS